MEIKAEGFELSAQQRAIWSAGASAAPRLAQCAIALVGRIDMEALRRALREVVDRHEILRTTFHRPPGMKVPVQVIGAPAVEWTEVNLARCAPRPAERDAIAAELQEEALRPFDHERGPVVRARLVTFAETHRVLLLSLPGLCADAPSLGLVFEEVVERCARPDEALPEPLQYVDCVDWQQAIGDESTPEAERGRRYWRELAQADVARVHVPFERETAGAAAWDACALALAPGLSAAATWLAEERQVSSEAVWLSAWQALLFRLTRHTALRLCVASDGRGYEELRRVVGPLTRSLPFVTAVEAELPFADLLQRTEAQIADARRRQEWFTGGDAAEEDRQQEVGFTFERSPRLRTDGASSFALRTLRVTGDRFKLHLVCTDYAAEVEGEIRFDSTVLESQTVRRMARGLETLLRSGVAGPRQPVGALDILDAGERESLVVGVNRTSAPYAAEGTVAELFEEQASRTPAAPAVRCGDAVLSFAELNAQANRLARLLRRRGVGPDVPVALFLERSAETIVAMLGVLKAGGAYVPLSLDSPKDRLARQLAEIEAPVVISQEKLLSLLPELAMHVHCVDGAGEERAAESDENLAPAAGPESLVYVIYTSGSTGRPKGVAVTHRNLVNYTQFIAREIGAVPGLHFATVSTLSADLGNTAVFPSLLSGGCLHVLDQDVAVDSGRFLEYLTVHPIDVLKIVPSHLSALLPPEADARWLPRRTLLLGGEGFSTDFARRLRSLAPDLALFNHYGPTETTVGALTFRLTEGYEAASPLTTIPIGRPIANAEVYVLDERFAPAPRGVAGELCIGGDGVARGYLHQPDVTAERFAPNPFGRPGSRLYRTGDLVRHLDDGTIEFLGRIDHQVKIRGFRIELGEIEAALRAHPEVREAVVLAREDTPGEKRLVAYVVGDPALTPSDLRGFLAARLPDYMVPFACVRLEALPLTRNGKVDRRALPAPEASRPPGRTRVAPRTATEEILERIWMKVLGLPHVSVEDNFFELGGDSILSIQIVARAQQAGLRITPRQLFDHQTIADLARVAVAAPVAVVDQGVVTGAVPLTPIQCRFFEEDPPDPHHFNQAFLLEVRRPIAVEVLRRAVREILVHHDALRLRFRRTDAGWEQHVAAPEPEAPFAVEDLGGRTPSEQAAALTAVAERVQRSLNLESGPLVRVVYFDLGPERSGRLLWVVHHTGIDGVSWRILLQDLETLCEQLEKGAPPALPAKTTSFKQWAERLVEHARSGALQAEARHWREPGEPGVASLPPDHPEGTNLEADASSYAVSLDERETRTLLQDVPSAYRTQIGDVLLTALAETLSDWTGARGAVVDLEGHGREEIVDGVDLSRTVGWFTATYPVRLDLPATREAGERLKSVKESLRRVPGRGIGYGLLRHLAGDDAVAAELRRAPPPQVIFNYLGQFDQTWADGGRFGPAQEHVGAGRSLRRRRRHLLVINAKVSHGRIQFAWHYGARVFEAETIRAQADAFLVALRRLITHCVSTGAGGYTPSDFSKMQFSQQELDALMADLSPAPKGEP
jgi:amino acid adenylation domain-containing protein/non-ribosomal peptide synthase protein (TIGR01720 family)